MDTKDDDVEEWVSKLSVKSTKEIEVPKLLFNQVVGQEHAGEVIKKAAMQKRHVLLIGERKTFEKWHYNSGIPGILTGQNLLRFCIL